MKVRLLAFLPLCSILLALIIVPAPSHAQSAASSDGHPDQIVLRLDQSTLRTQAADGTYVSPPTEAPRTFTHLMVRRVAHVPAGASFTLAIRASAEGVTWTDWHTLNANDDLWMDADGPDVQWSDTVDAGEARFWQVRATSTPAPNGERPVLRQVDVNTVDTRTFAPQQNAPLSTQSATAASSVSKPSVVSRTSWGNPDGQGSRAKPAYYPVNHVTIHHTADSSSLYKGEADWSARVRAEWSFHTFTRGWGDVGYNYLIDPNGVIYEGRAGGDDAVGFHDTANYGSMGVSVIGTYTDAPPSQASQDSLVRLIAWKTAQKDIDPLGRSYYYGCAISSWCAPFNPGAVVPNIAGHRQVTPGHTTCPGDAFMALLPGLKNRVKALMTGSAPTDNGDLEIDELESSFARSPTNWYDAACGEGGHTYYSYTTDNQAESTNSATWRPNIPSTGLYRVYAHIPQNCGLGTSPYASAQASYRIHSADGDTTRTVDQNTADEWIDLGRYTWSAGTAGAIELYDLTGEPLSAKKILFYDALKWVPESSKTNVQITDVQYDKTTLASGELLRVAVTIKNTGDDVVQGQAPQAANAADTSIDNGYVYDQDECFNSDAKGSYPAFPKESSRFRVILGPTDSSSVNCAGDFGGYPWRWGLNSDLQPGATQQVIGYVRFRTPGTYTLRAGVIQEYVDYFAQNVKPTTLTVTPEQTKPDTSAYDETLTPLARVYKLGTIPDNFLARTRSAMSIPRGDYVGSFAWNGEFTNWNDSGPLGVTDHYVIQQTRSFVAPSQGTYTFRTTTDDGSWLWVDGQAVIVNYGVHASTEVTGTIALSAGIHTLEFTYFDRDGLASAGYDIKPPSSPRIANVDVETDPGNDPMLASVGFGTLSDGLSNALHFGVAFAEQPTLDIAAGDQDGSGVQRVRWSINSGSWQETNGALLHLGQERFPNGSYTLHYFAVDGAGNIGEQRDLSFTVDTNMKISKMYLPVVVR